MLGYAEERIVDLKSRGFTKAGLYDPQMVGGTHVMYVLHHADRPGLYNGLASDPGISPLVSLWKSYTKPIAAAALGVVALGAFFHYIVAGPNEVSKEAEREVEKEEDGT
jgi:formate dehydrogenase iron-sulfur subunit